jgi:hypothetical protein
LDKIAIEIGTIHEHIAENAIGMRHASRVARNKDKGEILAPPPVARRASPADQAHFAS